MKSCIIIHGCPSSKEKSMSAEKRTYDKHWIPWTKKQLEKQGFAVETPLMPEPWSPNYEDYKTVLDKLEVDKDTVLIGHSCGGAFLVRWIADTKKNIKKLILVSPGKAGHPHPGRSLLRGSSPRARPFPVHGPASHRDGPYRTRRSPCPWYPRPARGLLPLFWQSTHGRGTIRRWQADRGRHRTSCRAHVRRS